MRQSLDDEEGDDNSYVHLNSDGLQENDFLSKDFQPLVRNQKQRSLLSHKSQLPPNSFKSINFNAGMLIQTWCRHQYLKGLVPSLMVVWYFSLLFLGIEYQRDTSHFIRQQILDYNCTEISRESLPFYPADCSALDRGNQYYSLDNSDKTFEVSLYCALPGATFFYDEGYWGISRHSQVVHIIVNFLLPLAFTYFIYETCVLALHDCLVIVPSLDYATGQPILRYTDGPYRVSWFILRDICCQENHDGEAEKEEVSARRWPGIRVGYMTSLCVNWFFFLTLVTVITFFATNDNVLHCLDEADVTLDRAATVCVVILVLYLTAVLYPTLRYYHLLLYHIRDLEVLAVSQYSEEFTIRRLSGRRQPLDLLPALVTPLLPNIVYYSLWLLPMTIVYIAVRVLFLSLSLIPLTVAVTWLTERQRTVESFYREHVFDLDRRWWCAWFIRPVHADDVIANAPLIKDMDESQEGRQ